jgi:hypothetical protein
MLRRALLCSRRLLSMQNASYASSICLLRLVSEAPDLCLISAVSCRASLVLALEAALEGVWHTTIIQSHCAG